MRLSKQRNAAEEFDIELHKYVFYDCVTVALIICDDTGLATQ